jgi:phage/plasmid-associated DNA primase
MAQVLPVAEERRLALSFFASLLSGRRGAKKVLVLTDRRSGNNGKTTLMVLFGGFFGGYTETGKGTKFVCKGSFDRDRDSHDAGTEGFRGKRLVLAEELKANMTLDDALLKRVAGGAGVLVGGRGFGTKQTFEFVWQAGIVLIFNENCCPVYDQGDMAFKDRLLFVPMRSKFVNAAEVDACQEPWTFPLDDKLYKQFKGWYSALADVLLEHFDDATTLLNSPPSSAKAWKDDITTENSTTAKWCEENLEVTGCKTDFVLLGDHCPDIQANWPLVKAMYAGTPATYVHKSTVSINGRTATRRYMLRGARLVQGI